MWITSKVVENRVYVTLLCMLNILIIKPFLVCTCFSNCGISMVSMISSFGEPNLSIKVFSSSFKFKFIFKFVLEIRLYFYILGVSSDTVLINDVCDRSCSDFFDFCLGSTVGFLTIVYFGYFRGVCFLSEWAWLLKIDLGVLVNESRDLLQLLFLGVAFYNIFEDGWEGNLYRSMGSIDYFYFLDYPCTFYLILLRPLAILEFSLFLI